MRRNASAPKHDHRGISSTSRYCYNVTLFCNDGSEPKVTVWAESPEHAIEKAKERIPSALIVVNGIAEEKK